MRPERLALVLAGAILAGCSGAPAVRPEPLISSPAKAPQGSELAGAPTAQHGQASWYGRAHHGSRTASGERFDMYALTAAHRSLRFGARVEVENLRNGRTVVVRINDRGPFSRRRIIDLSYAAARSLDMLEAGVVPVRLSVLP